MVDEENNKIYVDNSKKKINYLRLIILSLFGTGLLTNAIYIFGLGYYEGYIKGMGFTYDLFPLGTQDAFMWAYSASRQLAVDILENSLKILLFASVGTFVVVWTFFSIYRNEKNIHIPKDYFFYKAILFLQKKLCGFFLKCKTLLRFRALKTKTKILIKSIKDMRETKYYRIVARFLYYLNMPILFFLSLFWFSIKFLFVNKKSVKAAKSFSGVIVIFYVFFFVAIFWYLFPWFGIMYGNRTANKVIQTFEEREQFCRNREKKRWEECIVIDSNGTKLEGIIIEKKENRLALYTQNGPLTITEPTQYKFYTKKTAVDKNNTKF